MPLNKDSNRLPASLRKGHKRFLQNDYASKQQLFAMLAAEGQAPKVMWIGCADSRVPPERILGAEPGELFILRNVANIVPPLAADEASVGSALHFAVDQLKVDHLVVCGHSDCGGVKALSQLGRIQMDKMLASWIEYAVPVLEDSEYETLEELAKSNVIAQAERLLEYPCVYNAASEGRLSIHACFYHIGTGQLEQYEPDKSGWERLA